MFFYFPICLGVENTAKGSMGSKGVSEFSPELCSKTWVSVMDHVIRQAKLSNNTLEKHLCYLLGAQFPNP